MRQDLAVFVSSVFLQIYFTSAIKIRVSYIYWVGLLKLQISELLNLFTWWCPDKCKKVVTKSWSVMVLCIAVYTWLVFCSCWKFCKLSSLTRMWNFLKALAFIFFNPKPKVQGPFLKLFCIFLSVYIFFILRKQVWNFVILYITTFTVICSLTCYGIV